MKLRRVAWIGLALAATLALAGPTLAQGGLTLSLSKVVGARVGGRIQGRWTLSVRGVEGITAVTYTIDGETMATVTQAPFSLGFDTGQYPLGVHRLGATAETPSGPVESNVVTVEFVTAGNAFGAALPLILGILALVVAVQVVPALLGGRKKQHYDPGAEQSYGLFGGTICSKCGRPFALSALGINLVVGKLQRCPYCGTFNLARRASPEALKAAEAVATAEARPTAAPAPLSAEEKLRRQVEDSRYQDQA